MKFKSLLWLATLVAVLPAHAGLSLALNPSSTATSIIDPVQPIAQAWRVEFQLHDWTIPPANAGASWLFYLSGTGVTAAFLPNSPYLRVTNPRDGGNCDIPISNRRNVLIRLRRDYANKKFTCEIWNYDGTEYNQINFSFTPGNSSGPGGLLGSAFTTARLGFLRVFKDAGTVGGRPPITSEVGDFTNLTFDGNLQDTSGSNHPATVPGAQYVTTPDQIPAAVPRTDAAPTWSTWTSLRAGFPATLDGSSSFTLADGSPALSYRWQQVSGPSTVRWSDRSAAKPVIRGLIFGTYRFRLQITDVASRTATADIEVGAVATDSNGVVVQANPAADQLFGPMIAFGKNPWSWMDNMTLRSATVRKTYLDKISPPSWVKDLNGTISYEPARPGQPAETTIAAAAGASDQTITVANASKLDLSVLPTVVMVYPAGGFSGIEELRICSVSGNNLTVCYDGRGWRSGTYLRVTAPQAWPVGSYVRQIKTIGTGTEFLKDFCPAGPGEAGDILTSTGTVSVTPGSATLTGSGTGWGFTANLQRVRIQGTQNGQPFTFFAGVSSVQNGTTITMGRAWPATASAGSGLSYAILTLPRDIARGWRRPDGTTGRETTEVGSCLSDTQLYNSTIFIVPTGTQTAQNYSAADGTWISDFGPNYYDEVLAHYAGYLRSGHTLFRDNARKIGDYWAKSPYLDEGNTGSFPRRMGVTGMVAGALVDGRTNNWPTIRNLAAGALTGIYTGAILPACDMDVRETAYSLSWVALAALFDPVDTGDPNQPNQRSYWKAQLVRAYQRDQGCKGTNGEFPVVFWGDDQPPTYRMTKGSTTVKGTNVSASVCNAVSSGTINVTNGSTGATGTGFAPNAKLVISARRNGVPFLFYTEFTVNSSSAITMAAPFDGDSGSYPYQIESDLNWLGFAKDHTDHANADVLYYCRWVDSSTLELDRPWHGESGLYDYKRNNLVGYGQQPFIAGIKVFAMKFASLAATGSTATGYATLARETANWILSTGFDPATGGLHYARGASGCEPKLNPRQNCSFGLDVAGKEASRTLNAEAQNALRVLYEASPTAEVRQFGDQFYGSQWGKLGGPYSDDLYIRALESDLTWNYKWLGFMFGMGMAHQWPAVRIGGVRPAEPKPVSITFNAGAIAGAVSARVVVTQPSGAETVYGCASSPCQVSVDARQGAHWYRIQYLDAGNAPVGSSDPDLLEVN